MVAGRSFLNMRTPRGDLDGASGPAARSGGPLVWVHATSDERVEALSGLAQRLKQHRPGLGVLLTTSAAVNPGIRACTGVDWVLPLDATQSDSSAQFLNDWKPDVGLWTGAAFQTPLLRLAAERKVPLILADAEGEQIKTGAARWLPRFSRPATSLFDRILTVDAETQGQLIRAGVPPLKLTKAAPLRAGGLPLTVNESDAADLSERLAGRPVWLAAHVQHDEVAAVLSAHRAASRLLPRLLLVLVPAVDGPELAEVAKQGKAAGLRVVNWPEGETPDDLSEMLISDDPGDMGLWFRIAPLSFMGSSLVTGHGGHDPLTAAALGSAVLYGPNVGAYLNAYSRLATAGAARIVKDAESLAAAVVRLMAPDHAAAMALAGWEVVSESADVIDLLLDLIQQALDGESLS